MRLPQRPGSGRALRLKDLSIVWYPRGIIAFGVMTLLLLLIAYTSLRIGSKTATLADVGAAFQYREEAVGVARTVWQFRLPRLIVAVAVGASLGVSGMLFQSISRNPLGSPDIIGVTGGAAVGATISLVYFEHSIVVAPFAALLGALCAVTVMIILTSKSERSGSLIVFVGIGMGAFLSGITRLLLSHGEAGQALLAGRWLSGRLNSVGEADIPHVVIPLFLALPLAGFIIRHLDALVAGDDLAVVLGADPSRIRLVGMIIGAVHCVVGIVITGPIGFISLAAPHFARGALGGGRDAVFSSAFAGAILLSAADLATRSMPSALQAPVGMVTSLFGGIYFVIFLTMRKI